MHWLGRDAEGVVPYSLMNNYDVCGTLDRRDAEGVVPYGLMTYKKRPPGWMVF